MNTKLHIALAALLLCSCGDKKPSLIEEDAGLSDMDMGVDMAPRDMNVGVKLDLGIPDQGECAEDRVDEPDPYFFDANCDGMDGDEANSVFVASYGDDANPGTKALPKLTIQAAIDTAAAEDKGWVLLSDGLHDGGFELADGVSVAGGYSISWQRETRYRTTIRGGNPAIIARDLEQSSTLIGFEVEPTRMPQPGETVVTILVENSATVVMRDLKVSGGVGGDGADGVDGEPGGDGGNGGNGQNGREDSGSIGCSEDGQPTIGAPGVNMSCPDADGGDGGVPRKGDNTGNPGGDSPAGAVGGEGGPAHQPGGTGQDGARGENGTPGTGGTTMGSFDGWTWQGEDGANGEDGQVGVGGGGGGGGGGGDSFCDSYGGAGGGGGAGGCGGSGGLGGGAGGASIAIFVIDADVEIVECTIIGGAGGSGGAGGDGGPGGMGGLGGQGGNREDDSGVGGKGGVGGVGGRGGQGGGGAGGPAYGIYSNVEIAPPVNVDITAGMGGPGGLAASATGRGENGEALTSKVAAD